MPSFERIDGRDRLRGPDLRRGARRASGTPTARRSSATTSSTAARSASSSMTSEDLWLVRQPREAIMRDDVLEIPAGRLDVQGEAPRGRGEARARGGARPRGRRVVAHRRRTTRAPGSRTRRSTSTSPPACGRWSGPRRTRTSASRSSGGRSRTSTAPSTPAWTPRPSSGCSCCAARTDAPLNAALRREAAAARPRRTRV